MSKGLRERGEEATGGAKSLDIGRRRAGRHGNSMNIVTVEDNEEVLISSGGGDGKATGEVSGGPVFICGRRVWLCGTRCCIWRQEKNRGERKGWAKRALVRGERLEEGRVGQATKLRMDDAMRVRVEAMPLRSRSRCPYELEREGGGTCERGRQLRWGSRG